MLKAIIDDAGDPVIIAKLAKDKMKNKQKELKKALLVLVGSHQRMILTAQLNHIEFLDQQIIELDQ